MEFDVLERLHRAVHRDLALGRAVGVVEGRGGRAPLRDPAQVLDRQRRVEAALLRVEFELLELHQLEDLRGLGDLPFDHGWDSFVLRGAVLGDAPGAERAAGLTYDIHEVRPLI